MLDTVICPIAVFDEIRVAEAAECNVRYADGAVFKDDSALKAARIIEREYGVRLAVNIKKNIPIGAGLGGSAADGAGVFRAAEPIVGRLPLDLVAEVGADVPSLYLAKTVRLCGVTQTPLPVELPKLYISVLIGQTAISTAECFALYDTVGGNSIDIDEFLTDLKNPQNALTTAAARLSPDIQRAYALFKGIGAENIVMTGSGNAVIAYSQYADFPNYVQRTLNPLPSGFRLINTNTL